MALPPCRRAVALHELGAAGTLFIRTDDGCGQCEFPANALRCRSAGGLLDGSLFESGLNVLDRLCHSVREGETFQRGDALAQTASMSLLGFWPVALFLLSLLYLDSYKLVTTRQLSILILIGWGAAAVSLYFNHLLLAAGLQRRLLTRFGAPVIEEILKAVPIFWMIRSRRIGFLIDAAICGFAVGAGFALTENLYYLSTLANAPPALWVVRGFGTAVMHGGTAAIFAIVGKSNRTAIGLL